MQTWCSAGLPLQYMMHAILQRVIAMVNVTIVRLPFFRQKFLAILDLNTILQHRLGKSAVK